MIVTFKSKASGDLIYFKDAALKLLKLMGRDDKVPSALYADDVAAALSQLEQGLSALAQVEREKAAQADANQADKGTKPYISLNVSALPLIDMLKKAQKKRCPVQWE